MYHIINNKYCEWNGKMCNYKCIYIYLWLNQLKWIILYKYMEREKMRKREMNQDIFKIKFIAYFDAYYEQLAVYQISIPFLLKLVVCNELLV